MKVILIFFMTLFLVSNVYAQENPKVLDTITIKAKTKTFTNKNGTLKIDIANSIYSTIPNPIDLLSKLPNVQVSPTKETITIIGKGNPILYLDNQKIGINELNSLTVDDIKTIEIINNPSSKYEAEGRVVILIIRKLSKKDGFKVDINENASFQRYFNNYSGINASLKKSKLEFKANFNFNQITVWESNGNDFTIPDYQIKSNYLAKAITKRPQFIFGTGIFYKINSDDYLSVNFNQRIQKDIFDITTNTYNEQENDINTINTLNINDEKRSISNGYLNYNHKIKSIDGMLFSGFQYTKFNQEIESVIFNNFNQNGFDYSQNRDQKIDILVFSGRTDFEKQFKNDMKLELGSLYLQANSKTFFFVENLNQANATKYEYKEKNIATYSQLSGTFKKLDYAIGLRVENTIVAGKFESENNLLIDKNYINFFPKTSLDFPIDSTNTISINYSKTIVRPNFSSTSQLATYINPYLVWKNNSNLNPSISDEFATNYQYKDKSLRLSYYSIKNPVYFATSYSDIENLLTFQPQNFYKESGFSLEFTLPFKYKFWSTTNTINGIINKVEDSNSLVNPTKPYVYFYTNHIFSLPKKIELVLSGWGLTNSKQGIFERNGLFTLDFGVSKTFFKSLDCTLSYNDIFRQIQYKENFTINNISAKGIYFTDANLVSISLKYSFGKIKDQEFKEKVIDENTRRIR